MTRPQGELFDLVPISGGPDGAAQLYLKKDIFLQHVGNDLPRDLAARIGQPAGGLDGRIVRTVEERCLEGDSVLVLQRSRNKVITPDSESAMAERARSQFTHFNGGSHLTLVSHPEAVTQVIESAIASVH